MSKEGINTSLAYTLEMLLNDIHVISEESDTESNAVDRAEREHQHKLMVMQLLLYLAISYRGEEYNDDARLMDAITSKVNDDELLSGYLFHISQNSHYDYSWNYMRKRKRSYMEFLAVAVRFLNNVVVDINSLAGKPRMGKDLHVVFNDVIDVTLIKDAPFAKTNILWENFHHIATVKKDYNVNVKSKDDVLFAGIRKEAADVERFYDRAMDVAPKTEY